MSAKYKSPSFLLPNELNTSANTANDTGINSLYSMDFDGSNKYIDCGNGLGDSLGTYTGDLTISLWFNADDTVSNKGIFYIGNFNNTAGELQCNLYQYNLIIRVDGDGNNATKTISSIISLVNYNTTWNNLVFVYKSGDITNSKIYLNGVDTTTTDSGTFPSSLSFTGLKTIIGAYYSSSYTFNGKIDEVAIFNRALNDDERAALYDGTGSNIRPSNLMATNLNPVAYYPLGEQAQNSGYPGSATPANNVWQFPNGVLQDYVMDFDGVNDFIDLNANNAFGFGTDDFTISMWLYRETSSYSFPYILDFRESTGRDRKSVVSGSSVELGGSGIKE